MKQLAVVIVTSLMFWGCGSSDDSGGDTSGDSGGTSTATSDGGTSTASSDGGSTGTDGDCDGPKTPECNNSNFLNQQSCEDAGHDWIEEYSTKETCEAADYNWILSGTSGTDGTGKLCDKLMSERAVGYSVGVMVPDMTLSNCGGEKISLYSALCEKKAALIYFASGWCQPCAEKMPKLESLHQKYGNDIEIWVAMRENTGPQDPATKVFCSEWTDEYSLTFPVVIDPTDKHTGNFLTSGSTFPVIVMVSGDGTIAAIETGGDVDLEAYIEALLE